MTVDVKLRQRCVKEVGATSPEGYDLAARKLSALARADGRKVIAGRVPVDHAFCQAARRYGIELERSHTLLLAPHAVLG